jgi:SAM-dependent methyltransferase
MRNAGAFAPDGSPVEFFRRYPAGEDVTIISSAIAPGSEILELGCGAGRLSHALTALGHRVTAVDQSPEMLDEIVNVEHKVRADIETLDLGRTFDVVLLASNLINLVDDETRHAFAATCARHAGATVIIQRLDPEWAPEAVDGTSEVDGWRFTLTDTRHEGRIIDTTVTYGTGDEMWEHHMRARILDDNELDELLRAHGLRLNRWLHERGIWVEAVR